jgi:hypothetical protein
MFDEPANKPDEDFGLPPPPCLLEERIATDSARSAARRVTFAGGASWTTSECARAPERAAR